MDAARTATASRRIRRPCHQPGPSTSTGGPSQCCGAHRAAQAEQRLAAGSAWQDNDLVFTRLNGEWWNPDSISSAFRRTVKDAGLPVIRLHDVRHTHASLLLKAGVNAKVVSERLGHSSVAFTLDTYAHVMPGMQPEAAEMFMHLVLGQRDEGRAPKTAEEDE